MPVCLNPTICCLFNHFAHVCTPIGAIATSCVFGFFTSTLNFFTNKTYIIGRAKYNATVPGPYSSVKWTYTNHTYNTIHVLGVLFCFCVLTRIPFLLVGYGSSWQEFQRHHITTALQHNSPHREVWAAFAEQFVQGSNVGGWRSKIFTIEL